jgi:hypothetical protein
MQIQLTSILQLAQELGHPQADSSRRYWLATIRIAPAPGCNGYCDFLLAPKRSTEGSQQFYQVLVQSDRSEASIYHADAGVNGMGDAVPVHMAGTRWSSAGEHRILPIWSRCAGSSAMQSDKKHQVELALRISGFLHLPRLWFKPNDIRAINKVVRQHTSDVQDIRTQIADYADEAEANPIMDRNEAEPPTRE